MNSDFLFVENVVSEVFERNNGWAREYSKKAEYVELRQVAHWVLYYFSTHSLKEIAFYFGRRSHDMVVHSVHVVNDRLRIDYEFSCKVRTIQDHICLNGFELKHKYGRYLLVRPKQTLRFVTDYAKKPKERKKEFVVKPNLREKLIKERADFIARFDELQHKRRQIARTKDLDKVIALAKEISDIEIKMNKSVKQHIK